MNLHWKWGFTHKISTGEFIDIDIYVVCTHVHTYIHTRQSAIVEKVPVEIGGSV